MKTPWTAAAAAVCLLVACSPREPTASSGDVRVAELLERMTLSEKISLLHGVPESRGSDQGQAGYLPGINRLNIPALRFADGPPGVLTRYPATAPPATMALAATFSAEDARGVGAVIGRDARALGIDVALEPYINIHRDQTFDRGYNTYGEDPLLAGVIGAGVIEGIQGEGVMAQAKHFIGYDGGDDVTVDAQTLHEIYLPPFAAAVAANVSSIMCSYNRINGAYACGNRALLTGVLRDELHFNGFVTSDWGAVHDTNFLNAGLDLEMPGSGTVMTSYLQEKPPDPNFRPKMLAGPVTNLMPEEPPAPAISYPAFTNPPAIGVLAAVQHGTLTEDTVTRAAARVLSQIERFGLLDRRTRVATPGESEPSVVIDLNSATLRKSAEDAAVLLKNDAQTLPLSADDLKSVALIGPGAEQDIAIGRSGEKALGHLERQISPLAALRSRAADAAGSNVMLADAVADDMTGAAMPAAVFTHDDEPGLQRSGVDNSAQRVDADINFTEARGSALPAASSPRWSGELRVAHAGRYRIYLQVLGASAQLSLDGAPFAASGPLDLHGNVLQPGQDSLLPSTDGLDNVRREVELSAGRHRLQLQVNGDESGVRVQVRLAWVTPEQRAADFKHAVDVARGVRTPVVFAWSRGLPAFHLPGDQDQLISAIAAANPRTIVILNISEPVAMPWLSSVRAVLQMWYPGDEGGWATADLLLGRSVPSGRLPFTWPMTLDQSPANDASHPERSSAGVNGRTHYSEGIYVGYRWFDQQRLQPLFPFGFGLSYVNFDYSGLSARPDADGGLDVSFQLHNAGGVDAEEVPQLYLGPPSPAPAAQFAERALASFARVRVPAGQTRTVSLHAAARSLQYWSTADSRWRDAPQGRTLYIGSSSRDLRLQAAVP